MFKLTLVTIEIVVMLAIVMILLSFEEGYEGPPSKRFRNPEYENMSGHKERNVTCNGVY